MSEATNSTMSDTHPYKVLIDLAREKAACSNELQRAESATDAAAVITVIKENIAWCVNRGLTAEMLLEHFTQDELHAQHLYVAGKNTVVIRSGASLIVTLGSSSATVETLDSSSATVKTLGSSSATVETLDSSSATVKTLDSSSATVKTWGSSSATVKTWGSSSATVALHWKSTLSYTVGPTSVLLDVTKGIAVVGENLTVQQSKEQVAA